MFKILFALTILLEFFTVPMFLKYYWPEKCKQSMLFKMISATLFVLCAVFAMKVSGNNTPYAYCMLWGLMFGWLGDLLLHWLTPKPVIYAVGVVGFLTGHIFYLVALQKAIEKTYPGSPAIAWYEVVIVIALVTIGILLAVAYIRNIVKGREVMIFGGLGYGIILVTMVVKAARYVIGEWAYGTNDHMVAIFFTVFIGALLFVTSDLLLAIIIGFKKKSRMLRIINIATYFPAQILLASSILFVQSAYPLY